MSSLAQDFALLERQQPQPYVMLWVDTNDWNPMLQKEFENAGVTVVLMRSTDEALDWLDSNPAMRDADCVCVVTNQTRPQEGDIKAGNNLIDRMRDAGYDTPALVFCGQVNWEHNRRFRLDIMCGVTDDSLRDFVLIGRPGVPRPHTGAMSGEPSPVYQATLPLLPPPPPSDEPCPPPPISRSLRLVVMSDTHMVNPVHIPYCDYIIHAGDFTVTGSREELTRFAEWVQQAQLRARYGIIIVAGEHETDTAAVQEIVGPHCCFLEDSSIALAGGTRIYGASWHGSSPHDESLYSRVTGGNIHIIVSHQPPAGFSDEAFTGEKMGSQVLRDVVEAKQPLLHIFGHNHEGYACARNQNTVFIAAALTQGAPNDDRLPRRDPILIDIPVCSNGIRPPFMPLPPGVLTEEMEMEDVKIL